MVLPIFSFREGSCYTGNFIIPCYRNFRPTYLRHNFSYACSADNKHYYTLYCIIIIHIQTKFKEKWYITTMSYLTFYKHYWRILCFSTGTCFCYHHRTIWTGTRMAQPSVKHQFTKSYMIEPVDSVIQYCAKLMQTKFDKILKFWGLSIKMNEILFQRNIWRTFFKNSETHFSTDTKFYKILLGFVNLCNENSEYLIKFRSKNHFGSWKFASSRTTFPNEILLALSTCFSCV